MQPDLDLLRMPDLLGDRSWATVSLLGIRFFSDSLDKALEAIQQGGLIVFPSGPSLACDLWNDDEYRQALQAADIVFADSGAMALLWKILSGQKIPRYSGLKILAEILQYPAFRQQGATFWVMPSRDQLRINLQWLRETAALSVSEDDCYCAPVYSSGPVEDVDLLRILKVKQPNFIILCIGGGVQERLGYFLRKEIRKTASILCTGAAIGFLSGIQASIPKWVDSIFLGWLLRCMNAPHIFVPRYFRALNLLKVVFLYWLYGRIPDRLFFSRNRTD